MAKKKEKTEASPSKKLLPKTPPSAPLETDVASAEKPPPSKKRHSDSTDAARSKPKGDASKQEVQEEPAKEKKTKKEKKSKKEKEAAQSGEPVEADAGVEKTETKEKKHKEKKHKREKGAAASEVTYAVGDLSRSLFGGRSFRTPEPDSFRRGGCCS